MSKLTDFISYLTAWDTATTSLLRQMRSLNKDPGIVENYQICRNAEALLNEQAQQLRSLRECCDKQVAWIKSAMDAMHPECGVTADPDSLKGKTFRLHQTGEIERLKQVAFQSQEAAKTQTERAEKLEARLGDWDAVCKALWDRGYGQLPQQVNETPLGSCLRLIDQGTPDSTGYWGPDGELVKPVNADWNALMKATREKAKTEGSNNPLFHHVAVHCVNGQISTTRLPDTTIALEAARANLEKASLEASDLPLGSAIRFPQEPTKEAMILGRSSELVWLAGHGPKGLFLKQLMNEGAEYRLPGTDDWKPCYKLVHRTPPATA